MKKLVTTIALLAGAASVYSQGVVLYNDYNPGANGFNIHIYSPNPASPFVEQTGNSTLLMSTSSVLAGDAPVGTSTGYGGVAIGGGDWSGPAGQVTPGTAATGYLNGANFDVELYAAAGTVGTFSTGTFSAIPSTKAYLGGDPVSGSYGSSYAGMYFGSGALGLKVQFGGTGGTAGAPTVGAGSPVTLAIAAWYNDAGTVNDLATAINDGYVSGVSPVGTMNTAANTGPFNTLPGLGDTYTTAGGITSFSLVEAPEPSTIALGVIGASAFLMRLRRKQ